MLKTYQILTHFIRHTSYYSASYNRYLSKHILNIIQSKPEYSACNQDFEPIINQYSGNDEIISKKLNMIFNIYSLQPPLSNFKNKLIDQIKNDKIKHQSQLDRVIRWLQKNIKYDRNVNIQQILNQQANNQNQQYQRELQKIKNGEYSNQSISEICKILRNKFITIDSKLIYQQVKAIFPSKNLFSGGQGKRQSEKSVKYFWDKLSNIRPRLLPEQCNHPEVYNHHLSITKGQLRFRFPPQPNGYLHIGHIKSMRINFQTAKKYNGLCFLRYDDTNPQTQSHQYIDNIQENVKWLGYSPDKITFASDYFEQMLNFAIQLIKEGKAYVCESPSSQIQKQRMNKIPNKYRNRPIIQSLKYFPNLQQGQTLRLKLSHDSPNPTLRDPIIYRLKKMSHPRTGNKYQIYPMYDFAHCICDSLQHIDYSLCSLEFQVRRELYYIILDLLRLYKPNVWEYSRVNVQSALISKRKIKGLIDRGAISDWNDPRLLTIGGMMNRGYTPTMLINFIDKVNSSRAGNENIVQYSLLERSMKKQLFSKAEKSMMILEPRQVKIQGMSKQLYSKQIPIFTNQEERTTRNINLTQSIYIQNSQNLQQGQYVILKYFGVFVVLKNSNRIILQRKPGEMLQNLKKQGKKYKILHWISDLDAQKYQTICFDKLLDKQNNVLQGSKKIYKQSLVPKYILQFKNDHSKYWQMQRLGYFKFMPNNQFIRCVTL